MTAADLLSQKVSSLALAAHEIVVIVGLRQSSHLNYRPALLLSPSPEPDGRLRVQCLCDQQSFKVRRRNLLRASHPEERADLLSRIVWERQLELRVARSFLLESLRGEEGLALQIASHFPPRQTMALTTGFAMGKIVPDWSCAVIRQGKLCWQPIHGPKSRVYQKESVSDGIVRIDCAVVDIGSGCFLVAGGCNDHPSRAQHFFCSASRAPPPSTPDPEPSHSLLLVCSRHLCTTLSHTSPPLFPTCLAYDTAAAGHILMGRCTSWAESTPSKGLVCRAHSAGAIRLLSSLSRDLILHPVYLDVDMLLHPN